jgi:putative DNA primase/helicase
MADTTKTPIQDIDAIGTDVIERFDAVRWKNFNSSDMAARNETRTEVMDIRQDLLKVAAADPSRAAQIWDEHVPSFVPRPVEFPVKEPEALILNAIEPGRKKRRLGVEPFLDPSEAIGGEAERDEKPAARAPEAQPKDTKPAEVEAGKSPPNAPNAERVRMLLDGLGRQYLQAEDKYHFRDKGGAVAFEAQDKRLLTEHETPTVVASMIDLAEARGWGSLKLAGTKEFRREAWLQASLRDFEVTGYKPTQIDRARLDDVRKEREGAVPPNSISAHDRERRPQEQAPRFDLVVEDGKTEPNLALTSAQDQFLRTMEATMRHRGDGPEAIAKAIALGTQRLTGERLHVGTLVEVGSAPYQDRRNEKVTPFITLRDDQGQVSKIWGVDLPRALEASGAQPDQKLAVVFRGRQPVEVDVPVRNAAGEVVRTDRKTVERNTWEVVKFDRLRDEAKASVAKALDRQNNPASLKVFDPKARPAPQPKPEPVKARPRDKPKERTL